MSGSPPTLQSISDNELMRYIARKQTEIIALERAIAIQNKQLDEEMDEEVIDKLSARFMLNINTCEIAYQKKDKAINEIIRRIKGMSDRKLMSYVALIQAEIIDLSHKDESDENKLMLEIANFAKKIAMKEYKVRTKLRPIMKQSEFLRQSISSPLASIRNNENVEEEETEEEETEGGRRRVRRRTTVRRIKKLRRTRRGSNRTYK